MLHFLVVLHQLRDALYPKRDIQIQKYKKTFKPPQYRLRYAERNKKQLNI
jgi:hypothetical protein